MSDTYGGAMLPTRGTLSVELDSRSMHFQQHARIEVRDSDMRVVSRVRGSDALELAPGIYQVSTVLEDGREHSRIAEVREGEETAVQLGMGVPETHLRRSSKTLDSSGRLVGKALNYLQRTAEIDVAEFSAPPPDLAIEFLEVEGARVIRETPTLWILEAAPDIESVPCVTLRLGDRTVRISLPTSPDGPPSANACAVRIDSTTRGTKVSAWIPPERTVANAIQNMVSMGEFEDAVAMADDAVDLLRSKYADPTGAALGGLVLHRAGRLGGFASWLENLSRDFEWLPDGKILLAAHLVAGRDDLERALELALAAADQRILYTESYSILLGLLRRWPVQGTRDVLRDAVADLAARAPDTDWAEICLVQDLPQ